MNHYVWIRACAQSQAPGSGFALDGKKECVGLLLLGMGRQKVSYEGGPLLIRSVIYVHAFYCLLFRRFIFSKHHISYLGVLWLDQGLWDGPGLVCRIEFIVYV